MKSRTSFFNPTAFRKDILRYSPIWAFYTIFLLLVLFGMADYSRESIARDVADFMAPMAWINLFYGGICGVLLFADLFKNRLCNALHAFPMRREGWLVTHIVAGFLFSFVPNLLVAGIGAFMLWEYAYIAPIWLAISTMQFLFFFGTAVLAATCAGNLLGTAAVYGITHFVTVLIFVVVQLLYQPLLFGVRFDGRAFYHFFPLDQLDGFDYVKLDYHYEAVDQYVEFLGLEGAAWRYVGICAGVGILAMFLACLVYRRRNLEAAGDFISLKPLSPLFLLVCTIGAGAFLYMFSDLVGNKTYLFLALGMIIGYFVGKMLLERTLKVFGKKSLIALGVVLLVFGSSLGLTWLDPLGITTYVPKVESIEAAYINGADRGYNYFYSDSIVPEISFDSYVDYDNRGTFSITEPEEIAALQDFHSQLTRYRPSEDDGTLCSVQIDYKLKNGRNVTRYYRVGRDTPLGEQAGKYFNDMRYIFGVNDTTVLYSVFESVSLDYYKGKDYIELKLTDSQEIAGLLDAIKKDCAAGNMAQNWAYHEEFDKEMNSYNVEFRANDIMIPHVLNWNSRYFHLTVYNDSSNTIAYLESMLQLHQQEELPEDQPILDPIPE